MSNSDSGLSIFWVFILVMLGLVLIGNAIIGDNGGTSVAPSTSSPEFRYAKERFKQEGYNSSDAETAAKAVIKFHEAQKSR